MKSYTDIEQSRKLAEILPLESADGYWFKGFPPQPYMVYTKGTFNPGEHIPCWSLTALLAILQKTAYFIDEDANVVLCSYKTVEWNLGINNSDVEFTTKTNTIDACYDMILKLHKLKML